MDRKEAIIGSMTYQHEKGADLKEDEFFVQENACTRNRKRNRMPARRRYLDGAKRLE